MHTYDMCFCECVHKLDRTVHCVDTNAANNIESEYERARDSDERERMRVSSPLTYSYQSISLVVSIKLYLLHN